MCNNFINLFAIIVKIYSVPALRSDITRIPAFRLNLSVPQVTTNKYVRIGKYYWRNIKLVDAATQPPTLHNSNTGNFAWFNFLASVTAINDCGLWDGVSRRCRWRRHPSQYPPSCPSNDTIIFFIKQVYSFIPRPLFIAEFAGKHLSLSLTHTPHLCDDII